MKTEVMEDKTNIFESLLEKASDYGKTSYELVKLKAVDKTSDVVSSFIPHSVVFIMIASFILFLNLGIAFWLGDLTWQIILRILCCSCLLCHYWNCYSFLYAQMA